MDIQSTISKVHNFTDHLFKEITKDDRKVLTQHIVLHSSYARLIEIWGSTAEELANLKLKRICDCNNDKNSSSRSVYFIDSGGSYRNLSAC